MNNLRQIFLITAFLLILGVTSLVRTQANPQSDSTLLDSQPLFTPANTPVPESIRKRLPTALPAGEGEPGAIHFRVLEKRAENGKVTLILKEEETGEVSRMTQSVGTSLSVLEQIENAGEGTGTATPDPATEVLPTKNIESVKPGMQVLARISRTGKILSRTLHQTTKETIELTLISRQSGRVMERLHGLPQTSFATSIGTMALSKVKPGMKAHSRRGPPLVVKSVMRHKHPGGLSVYRFEKGKQTAASEVDTEEEPPASTRTQTVPPAQDTVSSEEDLAVADALHHIRSGTRPAYGRKWGEPFQNREGRLPGIRGAGGYREYYVRPAPGVSGPGTRRIVVGANGSTYYTRDHYRTFEKLQ